MGIWDFINSSTEAVKRNAPDPVKNLCRTSYNYGSAACRTSYRYGSAACTKIDHTVRVNGLQRLNQWLPDDEAKSKIGIFAIKFAKNAGFYALHEGYKLVPGGVAVSNIISETIKEVKCETLNEEAKPLEDTDSAPGKQLTCTRKLMDRTEMQPVSPYPVTNPKNQSSTSGHYKIQPELPKALAEGWIRPCLYHVDSIDNQKPEDVLQIFMMKEFFGARFLDDLMVPKLKEGKQQPK